VLLQTDVIKRIDGRSSNVNFFF